MAQVSLNNSMRVTIITKAVKMAFDEREVELSERVKKFGDLAYRVEVSEEQENTMRSLPKGFFDWEDRLTIRVDQTFYEVRLSKERPWPRHMRYSNVIPKFSGAIEREWNEYLRDKESLKEERNTLERNVTAIVHSVRTVQKLLLAWPEAKDLIPADWISSPEKSLLPAVPIESINAAIFRKSA